MNENEKLISPRKILNFRKTKKREKKDASERSIDHTSKRLASLGIMGSNKGLPGNPSNIITL